MLKIMGIALVSGLILGCSGNSSSTRGGVNDEDTGVVSGQVGTSSSNVRLSAVNLTFEGQASKVENDSGDIEFDGVYTSTSTSGSYIITLDKENFGSSKLLISTDPDKAGKYLCERPLGCGNVAYKALGSFNSDSSFPYEIRAGVGELAGGMTVNINWITDLASSLATTVYTDEVSNIEGLNDRDDVGEGVETHRTGLYNEYTIELANLHVSKLFSVSDVISITPIGPSKLTQETNLKSAQLEESLFYGSLVAALPVLIEEHRKSYSELLGLITEDFLEREGQLQQKNSSENVISLDDILSVSESLLVENIDYSEGLGATVPAAARAALSKVKSLRSTLKFDVDTNVKIDVPEALSNWKNNIDQAKAFITDLSAAIKNFAGENSSQPSFIDPVHSARLTQYFEGHEEVYNSLSPKMYKVLRDVLFGVQYLADCINQACPTSNLTESGATVTYSSSIKQVSFSSGDLVLSYSPVKASDSDQGPYVAFDIELSNGSLRVDNELFRWTKDFISDATSEEMPYIRLVYDESYSVIPPFFGSDNPSFTEPSQITVVWPNVSLFANIMGNSGDSGEHEITVLFETNLVAVTDPLDENLELRYNPVTAVFWLKSVYDDGSDRRDSILDVPLINTNALQVEVRASNALTFYPPDKWPNNSIFFKSRPDSKETISDMLFIYRGTENIGSQVVDIYDEKLKVDDFVARIRVYPYNSSEDVTLTQACFVTTGIGSPVGEDDQCSDLTRLAGNVSLTQLLNNKFAVQIDSLLYQIPSHGYYSVDLNEGSTELIRVETDSNNNENIVFQGLTPGIQYGPFTGKFSEPIELGIDALTILLSSQMVEDDQLRPVVIQSSLQRSVRDEFIVEFVFHTDVDYFVEDVPVGSDAQFIKFQYAATKDENLNFNVELGTFVIYRSNVVLTEANGEESVAGLLSTRVEYPEGDQNFGCGVLNRDELVAGGRCDALAYLRVRGALVGTVREERDGVFVARFVDGSWMVLGE
jgi:hypothetical protein